MTETTLAFIGGGNMAASLIGGLIADGWKPANIRVADTDTGRLERLSERFAVATMPDNLEAAEQADAIVLAIKPQVVKPVAQQLATLVETRQPLIISIAAGIREASLRHWLGERAAIVRTMPNTPALVQSGATALYANPNTSEDQRNIAESILRAVGVAIWVDDEALMDAVTALSGSGPAYFFLFMEAMQAAGRELGLPEKTARLLTLQTAFGAAKMALESSEDVASLRERVTSPGGTTERAIQSFQADGLETLVRKALKAAAERSSVLGNELEK
jgi:pyrroline-5-carboxylate reductase